MMKLKHALWLTVISTLFYSNSYACTPITLERLQKQQATMLLSPNGQYLLRMIPGTWAKEKGKIVLKRSPYTLASKLLKNGQLQQIWTAKAVFPVGHLSNDGLSVLAINGVNNELGNAVTLYKLGKPVINYKPIDFGITKHMLRPLPCDGLKRWLHPRQDSVIRNRDSVTLRTIDGKKHVINIQRGRTSR